MSLFSFAGSLTTYRQNNQPLLWLGSHVRYHAFRQGNRCRQTEIFFHIIIYTGSHSVSHSYFLPENYDSNQIFWTGWLSWTFYSMLVTFQTLASFYFRPQYVLCDWNIIRLSWTTSGRLFSQFWMKLSILVSFDSHLYFLNVGNKMELTKSESEQIKKHKNDTQISEKTERATSAI